MRVVPKDFPPKTSIWRTQDGRDIPIRQMESNHIWHCIRLIRESVYDYHAGWTARPWRKRFLPRLQHELERRRGLA